MVELTHRERLKKIMACQVPDDYIPYNSFMPNVYIERWKEMLGRDPRELYHMDVGMVWVAPRSEGLPPWDQPWDTDAEDWEVEARLRERFARYIPKELPPRCRVTEWGVPNYPTGFIHLRKMIPPLADAEDPDILDDYPFPDPLSQKRTAHLRTEIQALRAKNYYIVGAVGGIFETTWYMRGFEQTLMDFATGSEFVGALLDRVTNIKVRLSRRMAELGVDCIGMGDDISIQTGLLMSLPTWRRWLKGRYAAVIGAAHAVDPTIKVRYHCDGDMSEALPELLDIGINCINPIQPECKGTNPRDLKEKYGTRLVLWGTLASKTYSFGTPDDVRREIRERMELAKQYGGLVLTPNNTPGVETPFENFVAFVEAAEEYGRCA